MALDDPAPKTDLYECFDCGARVESVEDGRLCSDCGGYLANIGVPRER